MATSFDSVEALTSRVLRYFGAPVVCLELTTEQVSDAYEDACRWFMDRIGGVPKLMFVPIATGQTEFDLAADVEDVMEVVFPDNSIFQLSAPEVFDTTIPVTFLGLGGAGGHITAYSNARGQGGLSGMSTDGEHPMGQGGRDIWPDSGLLQILQHLEMSKKLLSADSDWDYDKYSRRLRLYPTDRNLQGSSTIVVEFLSNEFEVACLAANESEALYKRMIIEVMFRLGEIRSKFGAFPVPGGERDLNGADLLARAKERETELNDYVLHRFKPAFFFAE